MKDWKRKQREQEAAKPQMQAQEPANEGKKSGWSARRKFQVVGTGRNRKEKKT